MADTPDCLITKRSTALDKLFEYAECYGYQKLKNYISSILRTEKNDFDMEEILHIAKLLKEESICCIVNKQNECKKRNGKNRGAKYFNKIKRHLSKIDTSKESIQLFYNSISLLELNKWMNSYESTYNKWIKAVTFRLINNTPISNRDRILLLCLYHIHLLFQKDILSCKNTTEKRDLECQQILSKFDYVFVISILSGDNKDLIYHMNNAISHGSICLTGDNITFTDNWKDSVFSGTISISNLTANLLKVLELLQSETNNPLYTESIDKFYKALRENETNSTYYILISATLSFLMFHENNYENVLIVCNDSPVMEIISKYYSFDINGNIISANNIRNALSHNHSINDEYIILDGKYKLDPYDWLYVSDGMAYVGDFILFFLLMLNSAQRMDVIDN